MYDILHRQYQIGVMSTAVVPEVSIGSVRGYDNHVSVRRIDALIMFRDKRWAVEIKVSRSDLKRDIDNPEKQILWAAHTHSLYFFVPPSLLAYALEVVPKKYGVMTFTEGGYSYTLIKRRAKKNSDPLDLPYETVRRMAVAYGASHQKLKELTRKH